MSPTRDSESQLEELEYTAGALLLRQASGFYMDQNEPLATEREEPVSERTLTKWDQMPYALRIYESDEMIIYRLDNSAFDTPFRQVGNIDADLGEEEL